jgi:uncharacterized protein (DUF1501 family)
VRFVEVKLGGWDMHTGVADGMKDNAQILDEAMAALIKDLDRKGMLDTTMVVLATEFGRSPKININSGRDHYPKAFSCLLAGGGVKGGQAYGKTDKTGENIIENKVKPSKLNATIAHALGLPIDKVYHSPNGRPFKVADKGKPILEIF